ncbi:hypothetical protein TURU_036002 [Turdus rufiventris]|nr:hypothetical protein TURU_036002 [Turdus rufiventris]
MEDEQDVKPNVTILGAKIKGTGVLGSVPRRLSPLSGSQAIQGIQRDILGSHRHCVEGLLIGQKDSNIRRIGVEEEEEEEEKTVCHRQVPAKEETVRKSDKKKYLAIFVKVEKIKDIEQTSGNLLEAKECIAKVKEIQKKRNPTGLENSENHDRIPLCSLSPSTSSGCHGPSEVFRVGGFLPLNNTQQYFRKLNSSFSDRIIRSQYFEIFLQFT